MKRLLLVTLLLTAIGLGGPAFSAEDTRHALTMALDYGHNLSTLAGLRPNAADVGILLQASQAVRRLQSEHDKGLEAALVAAKPHLEAACAAIRTGEPLTPAVRTGLDKLATDRTAADDKFGAGILTQLKQLETRLSPEAADVVDWRVPPDFPAPRDPADRLDVLREMAARVVAAARMLDETRYLNAADFVTSRIRRLRAFLDEYGYQEGTPEYAEAMLFLTHLTDEARLVPEDQWPDQSHVFGARALLYVGGLDQSATAAAGTTHDLWDIYYLIEDPQSPEMLSTVLNAMNAPQATPAAESAPGEVTAVESTSGQDTP